LSAISIKELLEAGVHFGHQTRSWNPKMKEFIFGERSGIHIVDLQKTLRLFKEAVDFVAQQAAEGKEILFVGTKRQARESIEEEAVRCEMHFVNNRWLGGLLTNFQTVQNSIRRYKELEGMKESGFYDRLSKKEVSQLERERKKLESNLRGIRNMNRLPDVLFVIDSQHEVIAVKEANRLGIPIVAIVDTNGDPDLVDFVIPGNDDALRSIKLFTGTIAEAAIAGRSIWDTKVQQQQREKEKEAAERAAAREAAKAERERKAEELKRQKQAEAAETSEEPAAAAAEEKPAKAKASLESKEKPVTPIRGDQAETKRAVEIAVEEGADVQADSDDKAVEAEAAVPAPKAEVDEAQPEPAVETETEAGKKKAKPKKAAKPKAPAAKAKAPKKKAAPKAAPKKASKKKADKDATEAAEPPATAEDGAKADS
jgi:small subunit ribosomal protein S2